MRKIRIISVYVLICIVLLSTYAFAEGVAVHTDKADSLNELGLFKGTDRGYELEKVSNRAESAAMIVRLLGAEKEAFEKKYPHPFTDVPTWADPYVGYMYKNGLTTGISSNTYGSSQVLDGKSYMTFILRILGYSDSDGDFQWSQALEFANSLSIINSEELASLKASPFNRNGMVLLSYNSLNTKFKDTDETILKRIGKNSDTVDSDPGLIDFPDATITLILTMEPSKTSYNFVIKPDDNLKFEYIDHMGVKQFTNKLTEEQLFIDMIVLEHENSLRIESYVESLDFLAKIYPDFAVGDNHHVYGSSDLDSNNSLRIYIDGEVKYFSNVPTDLKAGEHKIKLTKVEGMVFEKMAAIKANTLNFIDKYVSKIGIVPKGAISYVTIDGKKYVKIDRNQLPESMMTFKYASSSGSSYNKDIDIYSEEGLTNELKSRLKTEYSRWTGSFPLYKEIDESGLILLQYSGFNSILLFSDDGEPVGFTELVRPQ